MGVRRGAIIGFGKVAEHAHVPGWLADPGFEIVAVADPSPERQRAARSVIPGVRCFDTPDALFASEVLDFVDIASPPGFHGKALRAAANAGVDIVCEKPITTNHEDYRPARDAIEENDVVLWPVHNWKFSEAFRAARSAIDAGAIGRVRQVALTTLRNGWAVSDGDWRAQRSIAGGGILADHGWHNFYLLLALASETPLSISATTENRRYTDSDVEDSAICKVRFEHVEGRIELTWAADCRCTRWRIEGDRGVLEIEDDRWRLTVDGTTTDRTLASSLSQGSHHPEWFPGVIDGFAAALRGAVDRNSGRHEAELCLELLVRGYASAKSGGATIDLSAAGE